MPLRQPPRRAARLCDAAIHCLYAKRHIVGLKGGPGIKGFQNMPLGGCAFGRGTAHSLHTNVSRRTETTMTSATLIQPVEIALCRECRFCARVFEHRFGPLSEPLVYVCCLRGDCDNTHPERLEPLPADEAFEEVMPAIGRASSKMPPLQCLLLAVRRWLFHP
jgi:hypothetical protein